MCLARWGQDRSSNKGRDPSATRGGRRTYRAVPAGDGQGRLEFQPLRENGPADPLTRKAALAGAAIQAHPGLSDEVNLLVGDIAIRLSRDLRSTLPHEITIVIPRVDIRRKFQDGKLVETEVEYAGITLSHSPRFPPKSL